jgi:hypothetical protein
VEKGSGSSSSVASYTNNQQDVKELNKDIRYIKTGETTLHQSGDDFFGSWKFWLAYLIPLLIFILILAIGHKQIKDNANIAKMRGRKANKIAKKRLKVAAKLLADKNQSEFYDEVMRALWGYIADKLNMPQSNLNKDNINAALAQQQVDPLLIDEFIKTLNECEFARYAPGNPNENMETVYNSAVSVISKIEDNFKKTPQVKIPSAMFVIGMLLLSATSLEAAAQDKQQADDLYAKEHYAEAAEIYQSIISEMRNSDQYEYYSDEELPEVLAGELNVVYGKGGEKIVESMRTGNLGHFQRSHNMSERLENCDKAIGTIMHDDN